MGLAKKKSFWEKQRVLITGNTGFKGNWLYIFLTILGADVYGYSLKPNKYQKFFKYVNNPYLKVCYGDINDTKKINSYIKKINPDIVFHLAAQPLVSEAYKLPFKTLETNIIGTLNLLESCSINKVKTIINVTTDKVYHNDGKKNNFNENDKLGGLETYSISKSCSDLISYSYHLNSNKNFFCVARSGNVIGGGDFATNRLIPDLCNLLSIRNNSLIIRNPNHVRPWQHVFEPINGYIMLAEKFHNHKKFKNDENFAWNFGPDKKSSISVEKMTNLFLKKSNLNKDKKIIFMKNKNNSKFYESPILRLNSEKSQQKLKWRNILSVEKAIELTLTWHYKYNRNRKDILKFSINQARDYLENFYG